MNAQEIIEINSDENDDGVQGKPQPLTEYERDRRIRAITWGLLSERAKQSILRLRLRTYVSSPGSPNASHPSITSESLSNQRPRPAQTASRRPEEVPLAQATEPSREEKSVPVQDAGPAQEEKPVPVQGAGPSQSKAVPPARATEPSREEKSVPVQDAGPAQEEKPAPAQDAGPSQAKEVPPVRAAEPSQGAKPAKRVIDELAQLKLANIEQNTFSRVTTLRQNHHEPDEHQKRYELDEEALKEAHRRAAVCRTRILRASNSSESDVSEELCEEVAGKATSVAKRARAKKNRNRKIRESTKSRRVDPVCFVAAPRRRYRPACWPPAVASIRQQYNPLEIDFEYESPFVEGLCGCETPCRHHTCPNGVMGVFCASNCCSYDGKCGNGLLELETLQLVRQEQTTDLAVLATHEIEEGTVIGQYLGFVFAEERPAEEDDDEPRVNTGYRYEVQRKPLDQGIDKVIIDAERFGCITRFFNHSCSAGAYFREVRNGSKHTVVVVAKRRIKAGEEVTVDYGSDLWFLCKCGEKSCVHRYKKLLS